MAMDWIYYASVAKEVLLQLDFQGIIKILLLSLPVLVFCTALSLVYGLIQAYLKIYDITLINRMEIGCKFQTVIVPCGSKSTKSSDVIEVPSEKVVHYQVVPGWKGLIGSCTLHIKLMRDDINKSVIMPIYNSGDIQRSMVFFVEELGVREVSSAKADVWYWCKAHDFQQQKS